MHKAKEEEHGEFRYLLQYLQGSRNASLNDEVGLNINRLLSRWATTAIYDKARLISGISGQDGAYLARLLLGKGYEVIGTSRDAYSSSFSNLGALGIPDQVKLASMAPMTSEALFRCS